MEAQGLSCRLLARSELSNAELLIPDERDGTLSLTKNGVGNENDERGKYINPAD
jgi:hypothetical protein